MRVQVLRSKRPGGRSASGPVSSSSSFSNSAQMRLRSSSNQPAARGFAFGDEVDGHCPSSFAAGRRAGLAQRFAEIIPAATATLSERMPSAIGMRTRACGCG